MTDKKQLPHNIKEAEELVKRYNSITVPEIRAKIEELTPGLTDIITYAVLNELTGFGCMSTCTLCIPVVYNSNNDIPKCRYCIYGTLFGCIKKQNLFTYKLIAHASTPGDLKRAYKARAKYIQLILNKLKK